MDAKSELLQALAELGALEPWSRMRHGQVVCALARLVRDDARSAVYEVEDDELLEIARRILREAQGALAAG